MMSNFLPAIYSPQGQCEIFFPEAQKQNQEVSSQKRMRGRNTGKYYYLRCTGPRGNSYPKEYCTTPEQVTLLRQIRVSLKLTQKQIVIMNRNTLSKKEIGSYPMLKVERDDLMGFYKEVKLKRTFGKNYRREVWFK